MDGYMIARVGVDKAERIFSLPQVRHVAALDDGSTFVAFDGDVPDAGGMILEVEPSSAFLFPFRPAQVRRVEPVPGEAEYLALYSGTAFRFLPLAPRTQVSMVGCDLVLTCTPTEPAGLPVWSACSEYVWDKRLAEVIV